MKQAVFLDRDGTIIEERNYLADPAQVELFPGASRALKQAQNHGFLLFIVTNQSGIGRGYYTVSDMHRVNQRLLEILGADQVRIEKIYFAPEAPDQPSRGRKPSPQFLFDARDEFSVDLSRSYVIGDKLIDLECGWNAGVRMPVLVRTGYGAEMERKLGTSVKKAVVCDDVDAAVNWILSEEARLLIRPGS